MRRDPIHRARQPVKGQYLVTLQRDADADAVAVETAALYNGRLRHVYRHAVQGFTLQLSDAAALTLARDPRVAVVEEDGVVTAAAVQVSPPSWGLDRIDQRTLPLDDRYEYPTPATAVNVYVIDSGIRLTHVEFEGRAFIAADFVDDDRDGDAADVENDDDDPALPDGLDCIGHGTHMAATIGGRTVGVAKSAVIWGLRVIGCDGLGTWSDVVAAVEMVTAAASRPAVVNISLAGPPSIVADEAISRSIASGITYVAAAGNANDDAAQYSPSRVAPALVVGSSALDDGRAIFSNWGPAVDLFAPGEDIVSASIENDTELGGATGTSTAAAHVTGVVALYLGDNPAALPPAVHRAITGGATSGIVRDAGGGSNRLLYSARSPTTPMLTITYPNTTVNWGRGSRQPITWTHNLPADSRMRLLVSRDGGKTYVTIAEGVKNTSETAGRLTWLVSGPNSTSAIVRVESVDGAAVDASDTTFTIADPYVRVRSPNGGEIWSTNDRVQVRWEDNLGPTDEVSIELSKNGGRSYRWTLLARTNADGAQSILLGPADSTAHGRVRILWLSDPGVADTSDGTFGIRPYSRYSDHKLSGAAGPHAFPEWN